MPNHFPKIVPQAPQNQRDDFIPGKQLLLRWAYRSVYETLWRMRYGGGLRQEVARVIGEISPQLNEEEFVTKLRAAQRELERFTPENLVDADWAARTRCEITQDLNSLAEPKLFASLMHANAPRTVRKLAKQSKRLFASRLGFFLKEQPERFLAIKASALFPTSAEKQIDFLARSIGAVLAGYRPSTGRRYLAKFDLCEQCGERPAVVELFRGEKGYSWCGAC